MSAVSCPSCAQSVTLPEERDDLLCLCPKCGQGLQAPSFWSEGKKTALSATRATAPRVRPITSGMVIGAAALTALGLGMTFQLDWGEDGYFKIIAGIGALLFAALFGGWWWEAGRRSLLQRPALTFVLPPALFDEVAALGAPVAGYESSSTFSALRFLLFGLLFACMSAVACAALLHGRTDHEMAKLALIAPLAAAGGIVIGLRGLLRRVRLVICGEGFVRVMGKQVAVCCWDEIEAVYHYTQQFKSATYHLCKVVTTTGQRFEFNGLKMNHVDQFGPVIEAEATQRLSPRLRRAYDSGETVAFGPVAASQDGLTKGSKTLPWESLAAVKTADGVVSVVQKDKWLNWCKIPAADVPNLSILLELVGAEVEAIA